MFVSAIYYTVKTVIVKGAAPVDPECTAKVNTAHVYSSGKDVYDVMLNQVNSLPSITEHVALNWSNCFKIITPSFSVSPHLPDVPTCT